MILTPPKGVIYHDPRHMAKLMRGVTCQRKGNRDYYYAQTENGREYCGEGKEGRERAEAARGQYLAKRHEYRDAAVGLKRKKIDLRTIRELSDWYMLIPSVQAQAIYRYKIARAKHLLDYLGHKGVGQVETDDLDAYREHRKREGAAEGTIDNEISLLRAMYNAARKRKKILAEMVPGQFPVNGVTNPRRCITEDEYAKLLTHAVTDDFRDVMVCAWESAMRSEEIAELNAGQVHLDVTHISGEVVDYIDLGIFDTKTGARRTVPVSAELKEILQRRLQGLAPDDRVFSENGKWYHNQKFVYRMQATCKRANVLYGDKLLNTKGERAGITFHCFRHTRTTKWVEAGYSDEIIRRATGHESLEAYRTYVKLDPSAVMRLVRKNGIKSSRNLSAC